MEEKEIKGIVESWGEIKQTKNEGAMVYLTLLDDENKYSFFEDTEESLKENLIEKVPTGSTVNFTQYQGKNGYWNFIKGSFNVVFKGDGTIPTSTKETTKVEPGAKIIRQNAGTQANNWLSLLSELGILEEMSKDKVEDEFYRFAEKFEEWVNRE